MASLNMIFSVIYVVFSATMVTFWMLPLMNIKGTNDVMDDG